MCSSGGGATSGLPGEKHGSTFSKVGVQPISVILGGNMEGGDASRWSYLTRRGRELRCLHIIIYLQTNKLIPVSLYNYNYLYSYLFSFIYV